jgi:FixJ family two-component response regulator
MATTRLVVAVVDDDESVRESLSDLVVALGFAERALPLPGRSSSQVASTKPPV